MSDEREDHRRLQLEANARAYANALREAQPKAEASQQHLDQMLTWAIGLMGAALFYLPNLLEQACPAGIHPRLVWIAAPWGLGILLALGGRVVGARHRDADSIAFYQKWHAIEGALLAGGLDLGHLGKRVLDIMNDRDENIAKHVARSKNLGSLDRLLLLLHARCLCSRGGRRFAGDRAMLTTIRPQEHRLKPDRKRATYGLLDAGAGHDSRGPDPPSPKPR